jgi:N-acetylglucosamine-6-phosphate deacetylase
MSAPLLAAAPTQLLSGGRVVTPDGVLEGAWVQLAGESIVSVGLCRPTTVASVVDLDGAWLLPGFVDVHVHGGGGHSVSGSLDDMEAAVAFHRRHGTTATLVSLVTAPLDELETQLGWAAELTRRGPTPRGTVLGSHLEGPFLSEQRCGAQNGAFMIAPDPPAVERLLRASEGELRMVTVAPELPGAMELIERLRTLGVIAALGHSDADYEVAMQAIAAGATHVTHLFNAMPPLHHRQPGLAGAALDARLNCELINDGRHLHPEVVRMIFRLIPRPLLITDAIDAAGVGDGTFDLGGQEVLVRNGEARLASTGSLAGSTLTMDAAVRLAITDGGLTIEQASAAASGNPASVLGLDGAVGEIAVGQRADLVVLDDDLHVQSVMSAGVWCDLSN